MPRLGLLGGEPIRRAPFPTWPEHGPPEEDAILRVTRSGNWWWIAGEEVPRFEAAFASMHDAKHGIAVTNGTTALKVALWAAGVGAGDEVIVPAYTFLATATSVVECNATPVFVDVRPETYNLDPQKVEDALSERTRAIVPVHFAGRAADMTPLKEIARKHRLVIVEDAAHAHAGQLQGQGLGSIGLAGCFSFQASKNLSCGEGGIVITNDDAFAAECRAIHNFGRRPGGAWYEHNLMSSNYRLTEFQGAILNAQLERLLEQTARREANATVLARRLSQVPGIIPQLRGQEESRKAYHLFLLRFDDNAWELPRERFVEAIEAEGIPLTAGYRLPLYRQPIFTKPDFGPYNAPSRDYRTVCCPVTEQACASEGAWMLHNVLLGSERDAEEIADAFEKVWEHRAELRDGGYN
jgi:dTDP-4-amino-4,6-dideoxygalactose transaminase